MDFYWCAHSHSALSHFKTEADKKILCLIYLRIVNLGSEDRYKCIQIHFSLSFSFIFPDLPCHWFEFDNPPWVEPVSHCVPTSESLSSYSRPFLPADEIPCQTWSATLESNIEFMNVCKVTLNLKSTSWFDDVCWFEFVGHSLRPLRGHCSGWWNPLPGNRREDDFWTHRRALDLGKGAKKNWKKN